MKHAIIVAHPNANSFNLSVARAYHDAVLELGHTAVTRDLYRCGFDPRLLEEEIPKPAGFEPGADVKAERALIGDADVFAFVYPLWFNAPPAMLTGYVQRVFGMGFGYGSINKGSNQHLLLGRLMIGFSSSGAPSEWLREEGGWAAIQTLFDNHLAAVCGMTVVDHRHFGRILGATPAARIEAHLKDVRETAARHFGKYRR
ncbi:NAD(P)H-dependent oxidoreductase [Terricaulis sp.]|uniref:NAD(P)H-dependent oxidoreductase n=1 Tax=Terricaulis sp. TaxID=2768686 RepID=UPI003783D810